MEDNNEKSGRKIFLFLRHSWVILCVSIGADPLSEILPIRQQSNFLCFFPPSLTLKHPEMLNMKTF